MTCQVVLRISPILYGRMELRAKQQRHKLHEWALRVLLAELVRLENEEASLSRENLVERSDPK